MHRDRRLKTHNPSKQEAVSGVPGAILKQQPDEDGLYGVASNAEEDKEEDYSRSPEPKRKKRKSLRTETETSNSEQLGTDVEQANLVDDEQLAMHLLGL